MRKSNTDSLYLNKLDLSLQKEFHKTKHTHSSKSIRVIIMLNQKPHSQFLQKLHQHMGNHRLRNIKKLHVIQAIHTTLPCYALNQLCRCQHVKKVYTDRKKHVHLNCATPTVGANIAQQSGWTGKGIGIAVLDTGVYQHPDLTKPTNRIKAFKDFIQFKTKPYDDYGHGTHCAGDAASNGYQSRGKYKAPAPDAHVIGVKVLDKHGGGRDSNIIQGIQWCIQNKNRYQIRILSLSFGGQAELPYQKDPVCQAIQQAVKQGLVVVTSAGNEGPKSKTIDSPGISPDTITVGATNDRRKVSPTQNKLAKYSSRGPTLDGLAKPDLVAPGSSIISLLAPNSVLAKKRKKQRVGKWYLKMSGTSMSTPIVAGIIAQLLQKEPQLTPIEVKRKLIQHATSLGLSRNLQGSGLINSRFMALNHNQISVKTCRQNRYKKIKANTKGK